MVESLYIFSLQLNEKKRKVNILNVLRPSKNEQKQKKSFFLTNIGRTEEGLYRMDKIGLRRRQSSLNNRFWWKKQTKSFQAYANYFVRKHPSLAHHLLWIQFLLIFHFISFSIGEASKKVGLKCIDYRIKHIWIHDLSRQPRFTWSCNPKP